ncbi:MAG: BspA family leucine-rich repeat surface protein [Ekhidna sp.]|nr:BspA family leucine-rich repeat surface protein [Ekhidna sp.]
MKRAFLIIPALLLTFFGQAQAPPKPFITTWQTTSANETVTIPTVDGETYNYNVKWGDGSDITTHTNATPPSHTYTSADTYTITISGTFPRIQFRITKIPTPPFFSYSVATKQIRTIEQWGDNLWTSMSKAFQGCRNLTINATDAPDLSRVTDISGMFFRTRLTAGDLSRWNMSNVTNMARTFEFSVFNGDISKWDVSSVTNMTRTFKTPFPFNVDISEWDVSSVTTMEDMFNGSSFNGDISKWNVSSVTIMEGMFNGSSFNGDISNWNVSSVTNMSWMFVGRIVFLGTQISTRTPFNGDISNWNVSNVTDMSWMFRGSSFNGDISEWDISKVKSMSNMFVDSPMSSENYDKLLIGWSTLTSDETQIPNGILFGSPAHYTCAGVAARNKLINTHSWLIPRGELVELRTDAVALSAVTAQCEVTKAGLTAPTAKSSCTIGEGVTVEATHDVNVFPITESTLITWTYTHNSKSIVQTQTVTITEDTMPPKVTALNAITVECSQAEDNLPIPTANDACDGEIMGTHNVTNFPITSNTTITWTYTDKAGNTAEQTQEITITDAAPVPVLANLQPFSACSQITENDLTAPTARDVCDKKVIIATTTANFPITKSGTITWTYEDTAGNTIMQTQKVVVSNDVLVPNVNPLSSINEQCEVASLTAPTATNCAGETFTATHDVASIPIKTNQTITWTYTDNAGNTATQTQEVTITPCVLSTAGDAVEAVVFPNPSGRYVEVQFLVESPIRILSVGGELMLESTTNTRIDAASLQSGLYLIQLPDGRLLKFVKR